MDTFTKTLLHGYCLSTSMMRQRWLHHQVKSSNAPVSILFYHRIADTHPNDWTMSCEMFKRQIDWLEERFEFVSLHEAQRRLVEGNSSPAVAITFDDGYADNCEFAVPLLLRRKIPFTYFVSTQILHDQLAFEHDLKSGIRLEVNSLYQIRAMAQAGVEIGAHTRTHADMAKSVDAEWIREELQGSVEDIERWIGKKVNYFAFPFGLPENMTRGAIQIAYEIGLQGICSAYGAYNFPSHVDESCGPFHLRRIHADTEWARFLNWMTFDPRKTGKRDPIDDKSWVPLQQELVGESM